MRQARGDERLVEHELGRREPRVEVPATTIPARARPGQLAVGGGREVAGRPLHALQVDAGVRDVAVRARLRSARVQARERVDAERQLLVFDVDELQRVGRDLLALGGDREDRLTDEQRLVGKDRVLRLGISRRRRP
jgi:hypothetical protein